ncbi:MAG: bifunctional riboflavin kinase/FAD synthetase [Polyangiaceae bacterium]|nr:bifunctional riboflavin kinase/FAD synthetase [Polyangiaceae bacterium]
MSPRIIEGVAAVGASPGTTLVAIGNFDGVHRGHQAVITLGVERARALGLVPLVLTFDPHPAVVFRRGEPLVLTPLSRKVELACRLAPELAVVVEPFTLELAALSAAEFAERVLARALGARLVVVGSDFRFGRGRTGDLGELVALGQNLGFEASAAATAGDEQGPFSSTRARQAILAGNMAAAEEVLGRPHALTGRVIHGDGRGRRLAVPTANLGEIREVLPADGVYACLVDRLGADGRAVGLAPGVMNLGVRPTVRAGRSVEVHLFDLDQDLYGADLRVHVTARLRGEQRFSDLDALVVQIGRDIADARVLLADRRPDPNAAGAWY